MSKTFDWYGIFAHSNTDMYTHTHTHILYISTLITVSLIGMPPKTKPEHNHKAQQN